MMNLQLNINPEKPGKMKDSIAYADDSIVSKTLHKSSTNNLTLFAFDAGQELSEHTSPFDAYIACLDGEIEVTIGGNLSVLTEGDLILMPHGLPHAVKARTAFKMLLIMMKQD